MFCQLNLNDELYLALWICILYAIIYEMDYISLFTTAINWVIYFLLGCLSYFVLRQIFFFFSNKQKYTETVARFWITVINIVYGISLLFLPLSFFLTGMLTDGGIVWFWYVIFYYVIILSPVSILIYYFLQIRKSKWFLGYRKFSIFFNIPILIVEFWLVSLMFS